jgi:hypothetical protein
MNQQTVVHNVNYSRPTNIEVFDINKKVIYENDLIWLTASREP